MKRIQQEAISRYENLERSFENPLHNGGLPIELDVKAAMTCIFSRLKSKNLLAFRSYVESLGDGVAFEFEIVRGGCRIVVRSRPCSELRPLLLHRSVTNFSGSCNYVSFFLKSTCQANQDNRREEDDQREGDNRHRVVKTEKDSLIQNLKNSSLEENNLRHCVAITNSINLVGKFASEAVGKERDASWTPLGQTRQEEREKKYREAGSTISKFWKNKQREKRLASNNEVTQENAPRLAKAS